MVKEDQWEIVVDFVIQRGDFCAKTVGIEDLQAKNI